MTKTIEDLNQHIIALISCFSLGGAKSKVHTEEIAYKCFLLNKNDFAWRIEKFQRFPDMAKVRKAIDRLKKEELIIGSYSYDLFKDGWKLSSKGIKVAEEYKSFLKLKKTKTQLTPLDKRYLRKFTQSAIFKKFIKDKKKEDLDISIYDIADLLSSNPNNTDHIRSKFFELKNLIEISNEKDFLRFLNFLEIKFKDILNENLLQIQSMASNKKLSNLI